MCCCTARRHQHGTCLSYRTLLKRQYEWSGSNYISYLTQLSLGLLDFLVFSPASWINNGKNTRSLCWTASSWLWSNTVQWNSVIFLVLFFLNSDARWHCSLRLCSLENFILISRFLIIFDQQILKSAGTRSRKLHSSSLLIKKMYFKLSPYCFKEYFKRSTELS